MLTRAPSIIAEARLEPPPMRAGLVPRLGLLRRMAEEQARVVVAGAPAGYGKSVLLAQHASASERPLAWVSLDAADDDPVQLLIELATAIGRAGPLDERVLEALRAPRPAIERLVLPGLLNGLGAGAGMVLVIDDLHRVGRPESLALIAHLCERLPARAQLLVGTRAGAALRPGRLRVQGGLLELGPTELAFGRAEIERFLRAAGVPAQDATVEAMAERTEGWPAGVAMAALAGEQDDLADYFSRDLLSGHPPECVDFLLRSAALERFCAPLCDAVLGRKDSGPMIGRLIEAGLFLVPLDHGRRWYRYHHLFGEVLRAELGRREAGAADALHRAAAEWHHRHGRLEDAVHHGLAGHDPGRAAELVVASAPALLGAADHAAARGWIERFTDEDMLRSGPLALTGAGLAGLRGEKERARRFIALAERASWQGPGPMGETSRESALALGRALFGGEGVTRMRAHALTAYGLEPVGYPAHEAAALALGASLALLGRTAEAVPLLEEAAALGPSRATISLIALGELAWLALADGMPEEAERHVEAGLGLARDLGPEQRIASAGLLAEAAQLSVLRDGDGRAGLEAALPLLVRGAPFAWCSIQTLTSLGRVAMAGRDLELAASLLGRARRELTRFPDAGVLPRALARAEHRLEEARGGAGVLSEHLTAAEMRVLDLLPTHLRVEEIAETLHLSKSTIKSHLGAIYRKLGVCRRSDAVTSALQHGILEARD